MARFVAPHSLLTVVLLITIGTIGCHRGNASDSDAAPASTGASSSAAPIIEGTPPPLPDTNAAPNELDELDPEESPDASFGDATLSDGGESSDASDAGDARDAKAKADVGDDAPLLGTKTFPDEEPQRGFRYVTSTAAKVHKAPKDGMAFLSIPRGTQVFLIAKLYDWYRIRFVDPSSGNARQGWIYQTNVAGPPMKSCPEGWTHHDTDGGWCERECSKNTDCKGLPGWKCSGNGCFYAVSE